MFTYLIIIAISAALACASVKIEEKTQNKIIIIGLKILTILFPAIIAGIRYNVGTDYSGVYTRFFAGTYSSKRTIEIGFSIINRVVSMLNGHLNVVMFICSLITISGIYFGLEHYKKKINLPLAFLLFMLLFYQKSLNLVRQMMAISIIFFGFRFLDIRDDENKIENEEYKKKYVNSGKDIEKYKPKYKHNKDYKKYYVIQMIKYIVCILVAATFHRLSFIMLIVPAIREIYTNTNYKKIKIGSYIAILLLILNFETIGKVMSLIPCLKYYSNYFLDVGQNNLSIAYFVRIIPTIIPYFFIQEYIDNDKEMSLLYGLNIIGCILLLLGYLTETYGERLAIFFFIYQIVLFPFYIKCFKEKYSKNKKNWIAFTSIIILFNVSIWFYDYIYKNRDETVPYQTIFSIKEESSEKI